MSEAAHFKFGNIMLGKEAVCMHDSGVCPQLEDHDDELLNITGSVYMGER